MSSIQDVIDDTMETVIFVVIIALIWVSYRVYVLVSNLFRYRKISSKCRQLGYRFIGVYNGNGVAFEKIENRELVNALLCQCGYDKVQFDAKYKIYDYVVVARFPEWNENFSNIGYVFAHGGVRLFRFISLKVVIDGMIYWTPISNYIDADGGVPLSPADLSGDTIIDHKMTVENKRVARNLVAEKERWDYEIQHIVESTVESDKITNNDAK